MSFSRIHKYVKTEDIIMKDLALLNISMRRIDRTAASDPATSFLPQTDLGNQQQPPVVSADNDRQVVRREQRATVASLVIGIFEHRVVRGLKVICGGSWPKAFSDALMVFHPHA